MNKTITAEELTKMGPILVGKYFASKAETIAWRDAKTGQRMTAVVARHTILCGSDAISIGERVAEGTKVEDLRWGWKQNQTVCVRLRTLTIARGLISGDGTIEPVEG